MARIQLLTGTSALAVCGFLAFPATAQCIQTGTVVTCASEDSDGFASTDDGLDIEILPGILVGNSGGDAFELDGTNDQTVTNDGTVESINNRAIDVDDGDNLDVTNRGIISADDDAIRGGAGVTVSNGPDGLIESFTERGIDVGDGATILNDGDIDAGNDAIRGEDFLTVTNGFDGVLFSLDQEGIDAGNDLDVTNDGLIDAGDEGIQALLRARIVNGVDGGIFSFDDAIQVQGDADIENSGLIISTEEDGIDIDSGKIVNTATGLILSFGALSAGIDVDGIPAADLPDVTDPGLRIENAGVIAGETGILTDPSNVRSQTVVTSGEIVGFSGIAMDLGAGGDFLELIGAPLIEGVAQFGTGDDLLDLSGLVTTGQIGGRTAFFDGGAEDTGDIIALGAGITLDDILVFDYRNPGAQRLSFALSGGSATVRFTDFEVFSLGGDTFLASDLRGIAPVPLPAGMGLLLMSLGGLGLLRRRKAARMP